MHLFFCTTFMTSSTAMVPKPQLVMPKLGSIEPEPRVTFYFANDRIHIQNGEYENRIQLNPLPKDSNLASECQPIIFADIHGLYVLDGKKNEYGQAMYLALQFQTIDVNNNPLAAELHWICGNEGEVGHLSPTYKENRIRVHTASLVAQLYNFMQTGVALQDISGKLTVTKWNRSNQAVFFDEHDNRVKYDYVPNQDTMPRVFTHRVNEIASRLGSRKPFPETVNESASEFDPIPVLSSTDDSTTSNQADD